MSGSLCCAKDASGLLCTEPAGHDGDHAARGRATGTPYSTWPRDDELPGYMTARKACFPRRVRAFERITDAETDKILRSPCVVFDMHGLYWTIPGELSISDASDQIVLELARLHELEPLIHG